MQCSVPETDPLYPVEITLLSFTITAPTLARLQVERFAIKSACAAKYSSQANLFVAILSPSFLTYHSVYHFFDVEKAEVRAMQSFLLELSCRLLSI